MRGKGAAHLLRCGVEGITPACAGKSQVRSKASGLHRDHPRVCGEKGDAASCQAWRWGSPPRMRGKAGQQEVVSPQCGITPAYAGKSCRAVSLKHSSRDHPRVCGEKLCFVCFLVLLLGSPPRMRGKGLQPVPRRACLGITPAYAGKSICISCRCISGRDHPRVCGEKLRARGNTSVPWGSPPRMRGKVGVSVAVCWPLGITPAYAGKSRRY